MAELYTAFDPAELLAFRYAMSENYAAHTKFGFSREGIVLGRNSVNLIARHLSLFAALRFSLLFVFARHLFLSFLKGGSCPCSHDSSRGDARGSKEPLVGIALENFTSVIHGAGLGHRHRHRRSRRPRRLLARSAPA